MNKRNVVITGATRGLGHALAHEFAKRGDCVIGCGRSAVRVEELSNQLGPDHTVQTVDVTDENAVDVWAKQITDTLGPPDILINNAGIINKTGVLWKTPPSEFFDVMQVNVMGTVIPLHAFLPSLLQKGSGTVVNLSSYWGRHGEANFSPYCASKFAIEGLTQSLAKELPKEIVTVSLDPGGGINTDMYRSIDPQGAQSLPRPEMWAKWAVEFITTLSSEHHGKALLCPHH